ncbi:hypothetical protein N0V93_000617 [Gnomoniopsis smithogilvyi]|uniref:Uncharacterized protein n=1 Tax=Gnomoniopsis smithogilvyi TaxID=1191159 RepID=A0A9W8Z2A7_9PEZI|nr:hypothetical protein N0V93_000617 [Gnomoniopsis smithogilvyi]
MLAITFMPLLMAAIPLASASPFTFLANQGQPKGTMAAIWVQTITVTSPATTATTPTAKPTPATQRPKETQVLELRDGGFAASLGTASSDDAAATTAALAVEQAQTTAKPTDDPEADSDLAREGYSQVTYYTCEAFATTTHCGWHVPVVHVSGAERLRLGGAAAMMGAVGVGILVGW